MKSIGGYFGLELPQGQSYHPDAMALNTGRNCLEYVLRARGYRRVYIPYYTCEAILEPFKKLGVDYLFYHINSSFEIASTIELESDEAILYTNYFGLKQDYTKTLVDKYDKRLIVDNTQAFYSKPFKSIDTFYSCRKFFGVPDGAYLYCDKTIDIELKHDQSWNRMAHLLKRIDISPELGYGDFQANDQKLTNQPVMRMSKLTQRIMASIDHTQIIQKRRDNYKQLHSSLGQSNCLSMPLSADAVPMAYPYLTDRSDLRNKLIENKVYIAQYWPNVLNWANDNSLEQYLTLRLLPIPIDQRFGETEMSIIISFLKL